MNKYKQCRAVDNDLQGKQKVVRGVSKVSHGQYSRSGGLLCICSDLFCHQFGLAVLHSPYQRLSRRFLF